MDFYASELYFVVFRQTSSGSNRGENPKGYAWDCHACVDSKSCIDFKSVTSLFTPGCAAQYDVTAYR